MDRVIDDPLERLAHDVQHMKDKRSVFGLLHDTTRRFEHDRRYLNDTRYIRLWLQYASFFKDPDWVYVHMLEKHIGEYVGAFYEQVAEYCGQLKGRWKDAEALVMLGIQKRAEPLSRLQAALQYIRRQLDVGGDKEAMQRQERRMAVIQECYSGPEEVSFEELRARQHYSHHETSFGSRSEETRLKYTPPPPSTDHGHPHVGIPHDPVFLRHTLARLVPPLSTYVGYHDFSAVETSSRLQPGRDFHLNSRVKVIRNLGQGGMAHIYLVRAADHSYALKVETPPNPWEFYILRQLSRRLQKARLSIESYAIHVYKNVSFLVLEYADQGTLLDCFNIYRRKHGKHAMPEPLAIFMTMRLLEAVDGIHRAGIIHGDLKLDNVMLALEACRLPLKFDNDNEQWKRQYLVLIDFGRSVDLTLLPSQVRLKAGWSPGPADLAAIRQGQSFPPRAIDYNGVADIAHWLLFGKQMSVKWVDSIWRIQERPKRYWHCDLWQKLFHALLNPADPASITVMIRACSDILAQKDNLAMYISQLTPA
ncbi:kinase-like domain-containing protein [Fennellomyces sp. T-0311]|nr:kinase-like domain-containing protein [Fennellomyces sp. T-0311]